MCWRFFERFEKGVERSRREHMNLVDDKHLVFSHLRWYSCLLHESLYMLYGVVACCVELKDVERSLFAKRLAALALVAGFPLSRRVHAVDSLCKDSGTCGFSHSSWSAEEIGMSEFSAFHCVFQRSGESSLPHYGIERCGSVLSCRNDIFIHKNR